MTTAKEIFEELGYKQVRNDSCLIKYEKFINGNCIQITFTLLLKKVIATYGYQTSGSYAHDITSDELRAIVQQEKELGWLEEEKQEIKQETNFEHYKDRILDCCIDHLAVVKGIPKSCSKIDCNYCDFLTIQKECCEIAKDWLKQPYKKLTYKLNKFEFDLIQTYSDCHESCKFSEFKQLIELKNKGYFKDIALDLKIHEVLDNYEVTK